MTISGTLTDAEGEKDVLASTVGCYLVLFKNRSTRTGWHLADANPLVLLAAGRMTCAVSRAPNPYLWDRGHERGGWDTF
jgi:hypothetical protein